MRKDKVLFTAERENYRVQYEWARKEIQTQKSRCWCDFYAEQASVLEANIKLKESLNTPMQS